MKRGGRDVQPPPPPHTPFGGNFSIEILEKIWHKWVKMANPPSHWGRKSPSAPLPLKEVVSTCLIMPWMASVFDLGHSIRVPNRVFFRIAYNDITNKYVTCKIFPCVSTPILFIILCVYQCFLHKSVRRCLLHAVGNTNVTVS